MQNERGNQPPTYQSYQYEPCSYLGTLLTFVTAPKDDMLFFYVLIIFLSLESGHSDRGGREGHLLAEI